MARTRSGGPTPGQEPPSGPDEAQAAAAQVSAMQLLGRQIATLTGAISRSVAGVAFGGSGGSARPAQSSQSTQGLSGLFGGILSALVGKIAVVLAPLAIVASAIGSPTSGFGVFLSAMKLLGGTLGSILLPAFLVLSALIYAVSGYIADNLLPVLKDWYKAIVDGAITAIELFEAAIVYTIQKIRDFAEYLSKANEGMKGDVRAKAKSLGGPEDDRHALDRIWRRFMQGWSARIDRKPPVGPDGKPVQSEFGEILQGIRERKTSGQFQLGGMFGEMTAGGDKTAASRFIEGLRMSMAEFRHQNAPPARYTTGGDMYREAQLAALQVSPFEKVAQDFMGKVLQIMGEIAGELPKPALTE